MPKSTKEDPPLKRFTMPLTYDMWLVVRQIAYENHRSMNSLGIEAMNHIIKKYGKNKLENKKE